MNDLLYWSDQLISKHKPRAVVIYEGDNDIADGISPIQIVDTFNKLVIKLRKDAPDIRIYFISIKPSISRLEFWPEMVKTNEMMKAICDTEKHFTYIDVSKVLLDDSNKPKSDIFEEDNLHLNKFGYDLWALAIVNVVESNEALYTH